MQIAMVAAGFDAGEADQVRRSMAGMLARGYTPAFATQIYQQILGFGSYGFQSKAVPPITEVPAVCAIAKRQPLENPRQ